MADASRCPNCKNELPANAPWTFAHNWHFQAMARVRIGETPRARRWFDKVVAWARKNLSNKELRQFWSEAADLLGQQGPDRPAATALAIPDNPFAS
jgi:hypothetical protein